MHDPPTRTKPKRLIKNGIIVNDNDHEVLRHHSSSKETSYQRMRKRPLIVISDDDESAREIKEEPQDWFSHVKKPTLPFISKPLAYNLIDEATDDEFIDHVNFEKDFPNLFDDEIDDDNQSTAKTHLQITQEYESLYNFNGEDGEDLYDSDMYSVRFESYEEEKDNFINDASTNYYSIDDDNNGAST
ncbi:hypothetical protein Tco_1091975 [Tanacetum coccineum]|uniref:Transcription factor Iwr1 domain-containing protein n=1 Tax=Tanacetum coccineum TaxID=301880 RepID=A0ABQ5IAW9_9ASTR